MEVELTDEQLKVMFFVPKLDSGGAEMHAVRLANALQEFNILSAFTVLEAGGAYESQLDERISVFPLDSSKFKSSSFQLASAMPSLRRHLKENDVDIIVPVMLRPTLVILLVALTMTKRLTIVSLIQVSMRFTHLRKPSLMSRLELLMMRILFPGLDGCVAISKGVKDEVENVVPKLRNKLRTIYNIGKPSTSYSINNSTNLACSTKKNASSTYKFIACGRLTDQKDYATMLQALRRLPKDLEWEIDILGEGELRNSLEQLARTLGIYERVNLVGFQSDPSLWYAKADVFILSSQWEGFGNVIVEAMSAGVAVVSTDCPHGPSEIIEHGVDGLLVPPSDPRALAAAIQLVCEDVNLRKRLATGGRVRADDFSPEEISGEYARYFRSVLISK